MGLAAGGLQSGGGGPATSLGPGATGTTLVLSGAATALQFISTQASGSDGFKLSNGARLNFSTADSSCYFYRSAADTIATPGSTRVDGNSEIGGTQTFSGASGSIVFSTNGAGAGKLVSNISAASAGATPATAAFKFSTGNALDAGDWVFTVGDLNNTNSLLAITYAGTVIVSGAISYTSFTDDSATPGNRTVNKVRGKNAVAIGATTAVITNSFVTANSQVLVTLESVDATALYLRSAVPSGTGFTVTLGPAAATAAVVFSWTVVT